MHDHLRHHASEEIPEQTQGKAEVGPVMPVLQQFQCVPFEVDEAIKVHVVEGLHGNLVPAMVLVSVLLSVELEIVLDGLAGKMRLLILARRHGRKDGPEAHEDWDTGEDGEEDGRLQPPSNLP